MTSKLSVEFEFEINEFVYLKTAHHTDGMIPRRFLVEEQIAQRCVGGVQLYYTLCHPEGGVRHPEAMLTRDMPTYFESEDSKRRSQRSLRWFEDAANIAKGNKPS